MTRIASTLLMMLFMALATCPTAHAAETEDGKIYARKTLGQVHKLDMAERTAVISGYRYYFGSPVHGDASDVRMLGYSAGSFELLEPGMKLRLLYAEYGTNRYVILAEQLPYSTDLNDLHLRSELLNEDFY